MFRRITLPTIKVRIKALKDGDKYEILMMSSNQEPNSANISPISVFVDKSEDLSQLRSKLLAIFRTYSTGTPHYYEWVHEEGEE